MFNFRNRNTNNGKQPKPANENLPADPNAQKPEAPKNDGRKKLGAKFNAAVKGVRSLSLRDLTGTTGQTIRDLRQPKEIGLLLVALVVPGGMFGWSAYRLKRFKDGQNGDIKPANENLPPSAQKPALPAPKVDQKPKAPKPPKGPGA